MQVSTALEICPVLSKLHSAIWEGLHLAGLGSRKGCPFCHQRWASATIVWAEDSPPGFDSYPFVIIPDQRPLEIYGLTLNIDAWLMPCRGFWERYADIVVPETRKKETTHLGTSDSPSYPSLARA